jgi:hypothetical protein
VRLVICSLGSLAHGVAQSTGATSISLENEMTQFHIAVIVGSLRQDSFNKKLATASPSLAWVRKHTA